MAEYLITTLRRQPRSRTADSSKFIESRFCFGWLIGSLLHRLSMGYILDATQACTISR